MGPTGLALLNSELAVQTANGSRCSVITPAAPVLGELLWIGSGLEGTEVRKSKISYGSPLASFYA
jgi:hypothetical protein